MNLLPRPLFASFSLLLACSTTSSSQSTNPDAGKYDGYYSEQPGAANNGSGDATTEDGSSQPRTATSSRGRTPQKGVTRELLAKRPPVRGEKKKPTPTKQPVRTPPEKATLTGVVPTVAAAGSVVEVFGQGLDSPEVVVQIGKGRQKVLERSDDRLLVQVVNGKGPLAIARQIGGGRRGGTAVLDKMEQPFDILAPDALFGQPRKNSAHGLVGNVYKIDGKVTELPAFADLGEPVAVIAVDDLDIASASLEQDIAGLEEYFGVHFKGSLNVTAAGDYALCVAAGDGAQLYLDENLIVDNDGVHETKEECTEVYVEAGEYQLDLLWFQAEKGEMGLTLSWSKDGGAKEPIPSTALFPPEDLRSVARK
jgi:hypothetical protein